MGKKANQETLPGMEARDVPEIEQAAENYRKIRDERCELSKRESEAKAALIQVLKNLGRSFYQYNGLKVQLEITDNVKVRASEDGDEEPTGTFRQRDREAQKLKEKAADLIEQQAEAEQEATGSLTEYGLQADGTWEERERLHREAVARWRRERPATAESEEEGEEESDADPQINEHGVYVKGVEVIKVPFPKKARKTEVVISLVKDRVDGMWRSAYSATAGVASFTGPICDYDPCHETREGAIAAAGWKARSFLLRQVDTGGLSEAAKRQVEAAIPALDDWLEINAVDHSAAYPDDEIEAEADDVSPPQLFVPKLEEALEHALLHHVQNAAKRWEPLQKNGATDAELTARISEEFSGEGGSSANGGWKVKGGKSPQFTWKSDGSTLKGKRMLAKVREVMGIGAHGQSNDPNADHSAVYPNDEIEAADEDDGGTPFPTEYPQAEIERMAESCAVWEIDNEKPVKICYILDQPHVITGREPSTDAESWASVSAWQVLPLENVGEASARTIKEANAEYEKQFDEPESDYKPLSYKGVKINCGSKKKPDWWVIVGSEQRFTVDYSADYPDDEIEAAVNSDGAIADDFTASRCDECGRIDGGHTKECSKNPARLTPDNYLAYAQAHYKTNHQSHARKMSVTGLMDDEIRAWKQQQAGNGVATIPTEGSPDPRILCWCKHKYADHRNGTFCKKKTCGCNSFSWAGEPEQEKKQAKLSPVEAAIDR